MSILAIGGVDLKTPSKYGCVTSDISKKMTSANGSIYYEVIATKHTIEFSYKMLTQSEVATILQLIKPNLSSISPFFTLSYFDTYDSTTKTGTFSCIEKKQESTLLKNNVLYFEGVSFVFEER
jgi:hypothetical protein